MTETKCPYGKKTSFADQMNDAQTAKLASDVKPQKELIAKQVKNAKLQEKRIAKFVKDVKFHETKWKLEMAAFVKQKETKTRKMYRTVKKDAIHQLACLKMLPVPQKVRGPPLLFLLRPPDTGGFFLL